jgi:hypothetical protein
LSGTSEAAGQTNVSTVDLVSVNSVAVVEEVEVVFFRTTEKCDLVELVEGMETCTVSPYIFCDVVYTVFHTLTE